MSNRYKGAVISATPPTTTGGEEGTASGAWTLEQQMQLQAAGLWPIQPPPPYIENVFSTYLYTGTGAAQTIINGINLSGKGGLVWIKDRTTTNDNALFDTVRGAGYRIISNTTDAQNFSLNYISSFNSTGFSLGAPSASTNASGDNYVSWTFRKQPKFFDVVTYTGTGTTNVVAHSLASVPGAIFIKRTSSIADWRCLCKNGTNYSFMSLNEISGDGGTPVAINLCATSTTLDIGYIGAAGGNTPVNTNGETYVAYIFAHDAGGFGLTGTDNVISCGSFTTPSSGNATITLGYEPQWLLVKTVASGGGDWYMVDNMRSFSQAYQSRLDANLSSAEETTSSPWFVPTATGFTAASASIGGSRTFIYIAIRRGPMRVPTSGTSVFQPTVWTGTGAALQQNVNINYDAFLQFRRNGGYTTPLMDKLRGFGFTLYTQSTDAESNQTAYIAGPKINNYINFVDGTYNLSSEPWLNYAFVRAPSFFDVVCYTGTGVARTVTHNLTVAPELMIVKCRSAANGGLVYNQTIGASKYLELFFTSEGAYAAQGPDAGPFNSTTPTSSVFSVGTYSNTNGSGATYVAWLFATCAGVSKVGGYTGTGAAQTINCGFTTGARFVFIKRTDSTGGWYSWDSGRGIIPANDPYLIWNTTAAEVTGTDYVDTTAVGFDITSTAPADINANGGTYIFLAIA